MKRLIATALICILPATVAAETTDIKTSPSVQKARQLTQSFGKNLKGTLKSAIKEGGLTNGIAVCQQAAPEIQSSESGDQWRISRTSLKLRNPANAPSPWQKAQLEEMVEQPVVDGKPVEVWRQPEKTSGPAFEYMRAIPTQAVCVGCHGSDIDPAVQDKLNELYPHDQATGFSIGDLRGAFVVTYYPEGRAQE